jgi:hypothetical protein
MDFDEPNFDQHAAAACHRLTAAPRTFALRRRNNLILRKGYPKYIFRNNSRRSSQKVMWNGWPRGMYQLFKVVRFTSR